MNSWLVHAEMLLMQRTLAPARACFDLAQRRGADPDHCSSGRWMVHMLQGRFEEAWRESDAIRRRGAPDPHRFWNGESLRGKRVMVRCLHGFGDAVQFLRYMPALRRIAKQVIVEVPPRLLPLATWFDAIDEAITWGPDAPEPAPAFDVQIEVTELPYFFRTRQRDLPFATNYIDVPPNLRRDAARVFARDHRLQVGVVWSAGGWNPSRSMPLTIAQTFLADPECTFWNLQGGSIRAEWSALNLPNLRDAEEFCADRGLLPLAAFISQLDLVLTVDTLAAHLAGALGRPVWLMLQHAADWRWMADRDDSPWYPSMRIFRQPQQGDWTSVAAQVQQALAADHASLHNKIAA